ncbi:hypothetical protein CVT24_012269 [Panaeolus cyanescens]|uniref:Uncharacterized protein n=1 Tax=Panaeolus cyanescens TaxID=181874 RepID=A0A409WDZ3_9AGAR|nr:hypothetical protein CVT24_012269 [Panaeolus cyanescens]
MANSNSMPHRGDRSAPTFDPTRPRELKRYFADLEYLFKDYNVTHKDIKIASATRYVDLETAELWETLPEFSAAQPKFADFKKATLSLYPDAEDSDRYSLQDLENCIAQARRDGMYSVADAAEYHRKFTAIAHFLKSKNRLSDIEANRKYITGFQDRFWHLVFNRLQLQHANHHPQDPWPINDVYNAVRFILQGSGNIVRVEDTLPSSSPAPTSSPSLPFKSEDISQLLNEISSLKLAVESLKANQGNRSSNPPRNRSPGCNFCGKDHYIRACELVNDYIRAGKCKRNVEGKVTLPSGAFVPSDIPGALLKDRIDEWHRRNPNQLAAAQLLNSIASDHGPHHTAGFTLSKAARIAALEAEIFALKSRGDDQPQTRGIIRTRAQASKESSKSKASPSSTQSQPEAMPEHPFRATREVPVAPKDPVRPSDPAPTPAKKSEPAYRHLPPICDPALTSRVTDKFLDVPIPMTARELLAIAPDLCSQIRESITTKRITTKEAAMVSVSQDKEATPTEEDDEEDIEEVISRAILLNQASQNERNSYKAL